MAAPPRLGPEMRLRGGGDSVLRPSRSCRQGRGRVPSATSMQMADGQLPTGRSRRWRLQESGDPVLRLSRSCRRGQLASGTKNVEECLRLPQCEGEARCRGRGHGRRSIPGPHAQGSWTSAEPSIFVWVGRVQGDPREGGHPRERRDRDRIDFQ
ncbi:hypothetical protein NDU88_002062 [Pleurodeles waltl]|uniref:Uncharacterized protein n=1 Tax=Pleurodeles waltl TaxID=8319 RepID=A0AAV7M2Z2_PLEWA|nr:hypothetical protein NDU88_002062 [Pleurodeles waltl]